jgi:hypothetical protein
LQIANGLISARVQMIGVLLMGAVALAGAIFLILELDRPFEGIMRLSDAPLRQAIQIIGR